MQDYSKLERFGVHYCHPTPVVVTGDLALVADQEGGLLMIALGIAAAHVEPSMREGPVALQRQADHSGTFITLEGPEVKSLTTGLSPNPPKDVLGDSP